MTKEDWEALDVQTHGLPPDLLVPIGAASLEAIERYVGAILLCTKGRMRPANAIVIEAHRPKRNPLVPLWEQPKADEYYSRLHPSRQLWVHDIPPGLTELRGVASMLMKFYARDGHDEGRGAQ